MAMNGVDDTTSAMALAKQILPACEGIGEITLPKATLKILLTGFVDQWKGEQDRKRSELKKVAS
jgi:hypothetical protein